MPGEEKKDTEERRASGDDSEDESEVRYFDIRSVQSQFVL